MRHIPLPRSVEVPARVRGVKLLDTSALIDGRIADICETHFLDGRWESRASCCTNCSKWRIRRSRLKRQRGRRGLEVSNA